MVGGFPNGDTEDDRLCIQVAPCVWLMDDHRWAFYAWARYVLAHPERAPLSLVHIDAHTDAVDGFFPDPASWTELQHETDLARLYERVARDSDITLASFIAPAIRRGWVREVHFFGCRDDEDPLDAPLLAAAGATQHRHETVASLSRAAEGQRLLFDLDLDVFNTADRLGEGRLWPRAAIVDCLDACAPLMRRADVVTVARSFKFSGTPLDTVRLTEIAVPRILAARRDG